MASYVPISAPWMIWSWAPGRVAGLWKDSMHRRHQEMEELWNTCRHKEGGKGYGKGTIALETSLHWFLCRKPVIPILFKILSQQGHILSSQSVIPVLSRTLFWLQEESCWYKPYDNSSWKKENNFTNASLSCTVATIFPQTTPILSPCGKSGGYLKLNDGGSELEELKEKSERRKVPHLDGAGSEVGGVPRRPRSAAGTWAIRT